METILARSRELRLCERKARGNSFYLLNADLLSLSGSGLDTFLDVIIFGFVCK